MKTAIQIVLFAVAIALGYFIYKGIEKPISFEKAKKERYDVTIQRLKDIRKAQVAFKDVYGHYAADWDSLINFVKHDSLRLVRKIGILTDSMVDAGLDEKKAIKKGLLIRDTVRVSVLDSLFGKSYAVDQLKVVPVKDTVAYFHLGATVIPTASGISVPVFEACVHNNTVLKGLDRQEIINLNDKRRTNDLYPGLKVGSLEETNNNAGNWE
ncbi:MAG: hypothetical protein LBR06_01990 [Bacteroidales bacterium]|jgi:hypothetical protein|nr:hypothetical protein [Bacteroidales bacterium]